LRFLPREHHRPAALLGRLPMTSFIDVVFLLLIFFMVTSAIVPAESRLGSALRTESRRGGSAADLRPQIVTVDAPGGRVQFSIGGHMLMTRQELTAVLEELPKEGGVIIRATDIAPVSAFAAAMQAARDAGFEKRTYVRAR
jgi:biopolymer transport protein ExbD